MPSSTERDVGGLASPKKRVLLVSYVFPPVLSAESIMVLKKVRVLARHFALTVVALDNARGPFPQDRQLEQYIPEDVEVVRVPAWDGTRAVHRAADLAVSVLFRNSDLIRYFDYRWAGNATTAIVERVLSATSFDLLMTNAQNMCAHLVGHRIRRDLAVPWVQHYSDPFFGAAFGRRHAVSSLVDTRLIRAFLADVQLITMPSAEMAACVFDQLPQEQRESLLRRTCVVPHTYDAQLLDVALEQYGDRTRYFADRDVVHVCYVGNLYGARGADLVLRTARRLRTNDRRPALVHVFGRVGPRSRRQLAGSDVVFHGGVDYLESLAVMQHADVLLLVDVPRARSPFFPSKLADYLGTGRPVVVVADPDSAVARIARETGLTTAAWDDEPITVPTSAAGEVSASRAKYRNADESLTPFIDQLSRLAGAPAGVV